MGIMQTTIFDDDSKGRARRETQAHVLAARKRTATRPRPQTADGRCLIRSALPPKADAREHETRRLSKSRGRSAPNLPCAARWALRIPQSCGAGVLGRTRWAFRQGSERRKRNRQRCCRLPFVRLLWKKWTARDRVAARNSDPPRARSQVTALE